LIEEEEEEEEVVVVRSRRLPTLYYGRIVHIIKKDRFKMAPSFRLVK